MSAFLTKQEQLDLILKVNPADDEGMCYHTWIRSIDDVLTFEEAVEAAKEENKEDTVSDFTPDFVSTDITTAMQTKQIRVYSSKPIINGNFVTPSMMEAASYSSTGEIYAADVDTRDIAWIDIGQGQVATNNPIQYAGLDARGII